MKIRLTGIADEAGSALDAQLRAHKELGWEALEMRGVQLNGVTGNLHEIDAATFDLAVEKILDAGCSVCCFGAVIANWAHSILDDFSITEQEMARAIPRMHRLGTQMVRVMSYAILKDENGRDLPDQMEGERFDRMRKIVARFKAEGLTVVHENCMNYGGMSIQHALRLQEEVPELKWVFDTGNPIFNEDRARPGKMQDAWDFYRALREQIVHVHIKDGRWDAAAGKMIFTLPGEGDGYVERIVQDLLLTGYEGYLSIEPHLAVVFHDPEAAKNVDPVALAEEQFHSYVNYGRKLQSLLELHAAAIA